MSHFGSNQPSPLFSSGQIVALDHPHGILYGEIIQIVPQRQMCWVRGIALSLNTQHFTSSFGKDAGDTLTSLLKVSALNENEENNLDSKNSASFPDSNTVLIDLYRNVDLLFPLDLFRVAFDTEIIPILSVIDPYPYNISHDIKTSKQCLNWFLKEIWQSNQDKF